MALPSDSRDRLTIESLATDTLLKVFSFLSLHDRRALKYVCKSFARQLKASGELYLELEADLAGLHRSGSYIRAFRDLSLLEFGDWAEQRVPFTRHLTLTLTGLPALHDSTEAALAAAFSTCEAHQRLERLELNIPGRLWLPCGIARLGSLRVLDLRAKNTLTILPSWLGQLTSLEELYLQMEIAGGVAEEFLPLQLLSMLRLRVLSLAGCWNVHIPLCVGELQDLQQLVVRGCNKLTFKEGAFLRNTFAALSLKSVTLINCNLHAVPYQIGALNNLTELDLSDNHLTSLPATFSIGLRNLRRLVLRGNNLKRLPRLLARLPALQALDLSYNADLEVHKSENDAEEPAAVAQARRAVVRPQFSHSLGSLIGVLPALEELDIRQRRDKHWDLESLRELGRLREVMQAPQGDLLRAHCSLRRVFM